MHLLPTVGVFEQEVPRGAATKVMVSFGKYPEVSVACMARV
jgi:hypothetical protein